MQAEAHRRNVSPELDEPRLGGLKPADTFAVAVAVSPTGPVAAEAPGGWPQAAHRAAGRRRLGVRKCRLPSPPELVAR